MSSFKHSMENELHRYNTTNAVVFDSIILALVVITGVNGVMTCASIHAWKEVQSHVKQLEDTRYGTADHSPQHSSDKHES